MNKIKLKLKDSNEPLIVHFSANWCGPCIKVKSMLESMSTEFASR